MILITSSSQAHGYGGLGLFKIWTQVDASWFGRSGISSRCRRLRECRSTRLRVATMGRCSTCCRMCLVAFPALACGECCVRRAKREGAITTVRLEVTGFKLDSSSQPQAQQMLSWSMMELRRWCRTDGLLNLNCTATGDPKIADASPDFRLGTSAVREPLAPDSQKHASLLHWFWLQTDPTRPRPGPPGAPCCPHPAPCAIPVAQHNSAVGLSVGAASDTLIWVAIWTRRPPLIVLASSCACAISLMGKRTPMLFDKGLIMLVRHSCRSADKAVERSDWSRCQELFSSAAI